MVSYGSLRDLLEHHAEYLAHVGVSQARVSSLDLGFEFSAKDGHTLAIRMFGTFFLVKNAVDTAKELLPRLEAYQAALMSGVDLTSGAPTVSVRTKGDPEQQLDSIVEELNAQLRLARTHYTIWTRIQDLANGWLPEFNHAPGFWQFTAKAHLDAAIMALARLTDSDTRSLTGPWFIKFAEANPELFTNASYRSRAIRAGGRRGCWQYISDNDHLRPCKFPWVRQALRGLSSRLRLRRSTFAFDPELDSVTHAHQIGRRLAGRR